MLLGEEHAACGTAHVVTWRSLISNCFAPLFTGLLRQTSERQEAYASLDELAKACGDTVVNAAQAAGMDGLAGAVGDDDWAVDVEGVEDMQGAGAQVGDHRHVEDDWADFCEQME